MHRELSVYRSTALPFRYVSFVYEFFSKPISAPRMVAHDFTTEYDFQHTALGCISVKWWVEYEILARRVRILDVKSFLCDSGAY